MAKPKWICVSDRHHGRTFSCSVCNFIINWTPNLPTKFCPECGSNMLNLYGKPDVINVRAVLEKQLTEIKAED